MDYRKSHELSRTGLVLVSICLLLSVIVTGTAETVVLWTGLAIVLLNLVQVMIWCRCPRCRRSLILHSGVPGVCPHCCAKLDVTEDKE